MMLSKVSERRGEENVGSSTRASGNIQQYTFGGKKRINGNKLDTFVKKEIEMRNQTMKEENQLIPEYSSNKIKSISGFKKEPMTNLVSPNMKSQSNSKGPVSKFSSEQRYIEARNEIPRFNEDAESVASKPKSIFSKSRKTSHKFEGDENLLNPDNQSYFSNHIQEY